jgi:hypothetical protein
MGILPMVMRGFKDSSHEHGQASEQKARTGRERIHGPGLGDDRHDAGYEQDAERQELIFKEESKELA